MYGCGTELAVSTVAPFTQTSCSCFGTTSIVSTIAAIAVFFTRKSVAVPAPGSATHPIPK